MFNLKKIIISIGIIGIGGIALAVSLPESFTLEIYELKTDKLVSIEQTFNDPTSKEYIKDLKANDKARIKSKEISKLTPIGKYTKNNIEVEIVGNIKAIEVNGNHGIELFARAWKNKKQLGFGKDGSVDIERFRIYNPPILVDDPNGTIVRTWTDEITGELKQRKLREDPKEALLQSLEHTIGLVGKENTTIIKGSIGNTTSTFYPSAGAVSPVDGYIRNQNAVWATARDAADGNLASATATALYSHLNPDGTVYTIWRSIILFDTSAIADTDTVDSATFSLYLTNTADAINDAYSYTGVVTSTPASNADVVTADFDQLGTVLQAPSLDHTGLSTAAYKDFTFNATGISNISKTGVSKFGIREGHDIENQSVAVSPDRVSGNYWSAADETGTTQDPKLVVVHSAVVATSIEADLILFE